MKYLDAAGEPFSASDHEDEPMGLNLGPPVQSENAVTLIVLERGP
jgi:hypothetical protein